MERLSPAVLLVVALLAGPAFADEKDHEYARRLVEEGVILPLEALVDRALLRQPGRLLEAELEKKKGRLVYELEIVDRKGRVWELYYDAKSGEFLRRKED